MSGAYCLLNGVPVVRGEVVLPRVGVWHAELELEGDAPQQGAVRLEWWGRKLLLNGTVRYGGTEDGATQTHVVGGAGGLTAKVEPKAYRDVPRRQVLLELLSTAGETLSPLSDPTWLGAQLPFWTILRGTVGSALTLLVELEDGISWRVLADGRFWVGREAWGEVAVPYEELSRSPRAFQMEVATETPALQPGCVFEGQRLSTVTYQLEEHDARVLLNFEPPEAT